ncbi:hypothetical protein ABZ456_04190 [Streptomyces sp. NPDC005776]|uniref:hypothetical protein n=1 Tax=Streptomyces sp. NPDC005776 TaxID=3154676 RepID=UPI0033DB7180
MSDDSGEDGRSGADAGADAEAVAGTSLPGRAAPVALDLPDTADGLRRYRASALRWWAAGAAGMLPALLLAVFSDGFGRSFVPPLATWGVLLPLGGAAVSLRARRMRRVLASGPWTAHTSVVLQRGVNGAAVVLHGPDPRALLPLTPSTVQWRLGLLNRTDGVVWWCGDPLTGGVLAPSGGTELIRATPIPGRRARSLAARPEVKDLLTRPAPPQPQTAPPQESGLPVGTGPAVETKRRRPWWRGTFRYLLLVGCLMMALATSWTVAAEDDPQVNLTVIGERADGRCDVRWTDPFDGRPRTGPFHCHGYTDDALKGWDTGFVVSYEPFKGDLYDSELRGSPAVPTTDGVGLGGLALAVIGLAGGTIRVVRARRLRNRALPPYTIPDQGRAPMTGPQVTGAVPGQGRAPMDDTGATPQPPPPFSYAAFAAAAEFQARLRGAAPAKPVEAAAGRRGQPLIWWRVRTLREIASIPAALWCLSYGGCIAALILITGIDAVSTWIKVMGSLVGAFGLFTFFQAVTSGIPKARLLAAAATAAEPRTRRYALLHDNRADGPTLVLFAAESPGTAEPDEEPGRLPHRVAPSATARPESLLPLLPPGPQKDPWAGLPAPTGTVELRGWLDGRPLAVAWIDGRPYWPQDVCEDIDPVDSRGLGVRFGIGPDRV